MKTYFKIIALILCLSLITIGVSPATANAQNRDYLKVQTKIQQQYDNGVPAEDILINLTDKEKEIIQKKYAETMDDEIISYFGEDLKKNEEVIIIDLLATEMYKFYEENGYFPCENNN